MRPRELGRFLRRITGKVVEKERPQRAVVTAITDRDTTGEIVATQLDGKTIYTHSPTTYDIGVGDEVLTQKLQIGMARARYSIAGFLKGSGGSYIPTLRIASAVQARTVVHKNAGYTATITDLFILCDASGGAFTITLPAVSGNIGIMYHIKKIDSSANAVTVDASGAETIDDSTTAVIISQYDSISIISDGVEWWIF